MAWQSLDGDGQTSPLKRTWSEEITAFNYGEICAWSPSQSIVKGRGVRDTMVGSIIWVLGSSRDWFIKHVNQCDDPENYLFYGYSHPSCKNYDLPTPQHVFDAFSGINGDLKGMVRDAVPIF